MVDAFQAKSMTDNGAIGQGFGAYLGLIFHAYMWPCMHSYELSQETWWKPFARLGVAVLMLVPFLPLILLTSNQISNVYCLMFFKTFIPSFAEGFIFFGVADYVNMRLKLL